MVHDFRVVVKVAFTMLASNERKLSQMNLMNVIDFCRYLPTMRRYGKQTVQKAVSLKLNDKYLAPARDLTQFDWQLNKKLQAQYKQHMLKRQRKRQPLASKGSAAEMDADADAEVNENESPESEGDSQQLLVLQGLARSQHGLNDSESTLSASISISMSESSSVM